MIEGDVVVDITWAKPDPIRAAKLRAEMRACRKCEICAGGTAGPVVFAGPQNPVCAAVGEAPGRVEVDEGRGFVGPSGRLLRALMEKAGIEVGRVWWGNTVGCWPKADNKTRSPNMDEMRNCRPWLIDGLRTAGVRYVLLVGATALSSWRSDLGVMDNHGVVGVWNDTWIVMPIHHPAAALRQPGLKDVIVKDLVKWAGIVNGAKDWRGEVRCVKCGYDARVIDRDGLWWCGVHEQKGRDRWREERNRWMDTGGSGERLL